MGGTLEVLLVSAEGIRHTNIIGKPTYYVVLECGSEVHKSKTSKGLLSGDEKVFWNEKFMFELPRSEVDNETYLKLKIMDEEIFSRGGFVGETTIYLKGIIIEGKDRGFIEVKPAPYNVVLDDDTFQGQIKIGLQYTHNGTKQTESEENVPEKNDGEGPMEHTLCRRLVNFWHISWLRFLFGCKSKKMVRSSDKQELN